MRPGMNRRMARIIDATKATVAKEEWSVLKAITAIASRAPQVATNGIR